MMLPLPEGVVMLEKGERVLTRTECRALNARLDFSNCVFGSVATFHINGLTTTEALAVMAAVRRAVAGCNNRPHDIVTQAIEAQRRSTPPQEALAHDRWRPGVDRSDWRLGMAVLDESRDAYGWGV